ncbi:MAG: YggS family pyridoxal phosphate-dependent enzyme [Akkermansiaceae bacterium]
MSVVDNLGEIKSRIEKACERAGRDAGEVELIAVSKTWPAEHVQKAVDAGQRVFGENKLQEGQEKIPVMSQELEWHYIGGLQRNKVRKVLGLFHVIHSIDSLKLAKYTDGVAADMGINPSVLLQVNIGEEASKGGFSVEELEVSFSELLELKHLKIVGLMCIPPAVEVSVDAKVWFRKVADLRDKLESAHGFKLPHLSMGMSGDFETAIAEGATYVRVGTSIFGGR